MSRRYAYGRSRLGFTDDPSRLAPQRSTEDVLLRITYRDGRSVIRYASPGRAAYMLERYRRSRFVESSRQPCWVEEVKPCR